jgi:hydroxymethylpyrimidine/phosphomethylpyrimidine kinase
MNAKQSESSEPASKDPNLNVRTIKPKAVALTIAGSDPSGGAGLQADLKSFQQLGVYGASVITLLTVQNTQGVTAVEIMSPELIVAQYDAVIDDIPPRAIKTGALGSAAVVSAVSQRLRNATCPIVVDPVLVSKHGHSLASDEVVEAYQRELLPRAHIVTPNRFEAERLTGCKIDDLDSAGKAIHLLQHFGTRHPLIKLGAIDGNSVHVLGLDDEDICLSVPRLPEGNSHGAGCILSAAITASLALGETDVKSAVLFGIHRVYEALHVHTKLGQGIHPAEIRAMVAR